MNARHLVIAFAAALLAAGAWWLLRDDLQTEAARPVESSHAVAPRAADEVQPIEATPVELAPRADVESEPKTALEAPVAPASAANDRSPDVEGTLSLEQPDGTKELVAEANFKLIAWTGNSGRHVDVEVHGGRWAARFLGELAGNVTRVQFTGVHIAQRLAVVREPADAVAIPPDKQIAVSVFFPASTILRVVDAASGAELDGVDLVRSSSFSNHGGAHPGLDIDAIALARHLSSPVDLATLDHDREFGVLDLVVGAPGHAWTKITVDTRTGGERVLRLELGGSLRLTTVDNSGSRAVQLRLRRAGSSPLLSVPCGRAGELAIDGLEAGPLSITAELGEWFDDPVELGRAETEIVAGREARATLTIEPAPRAEMASASGIVVVPAEWKVERLTLSLDLLGTPLDSASDRIELDARRLEDHANGDTVFAWSHEKLQVGRYELEVYRPQASVVIDVPSGGRSDFRFELAPPAELLVRVVDDVTGDDAEVPGLLWNPRRPEGVNGGGLDNAEFDAKTKRFTIRAPVGLIDLMLAFGSPYEHRTDSVTLAPGRQEHTLRVRRATTIEVALRDGEAVLPFPNEWQAHIESEDGKPIFASSTMSVTLRTYSVPTAGRYRVKLDPINGYEPIPDQLVDVAEAKTTRLEVALTKIR